ncbi:MAG TPA: family 1 glycosylhydrolase [Magnetospirillaceae bacterium]|nr:family 1 glycosylhydrolase [Magnetospirillaceae bacterium]
MKHEPKLPLQFPKHFLWGAGSSAHQVEGGNHNQWSVWELEHANVLAQKAKYYNGTLPKWEVIKHEATRPENYVSGLATDHYRRYQEDFDLLKKMDMNAWRFSIEWSRVEPEEGAWNAEAIEHYRTYLQRLQRMGIEPIVTLWHWTVPVWFEQKGGWVKRSNVHYFERFAAKVFEELGRDFRYVIVLNEPEIYIIRSFIEGLWPPQRTSKVLATKVIFNLLAAHKRVYRLAHRAGRKYRVGIAKLSAYYYAGDDAWLSKFTASIGRWAGNYFVVNRLKKHLDFLGLNYYRGYRYYGYRIHQPTETVNDMGWDMQPEKLEAVIKDFYDRYNIPIIITENGVADRDDESRKWWISQTLIVMNRLMQSGVKIEGYIHWSLTDNFEWDAGFWPRFGLAAIDYKTRSRRLRPSGVWFGGIIKKLRS